MHPYKQSMKYASKRKKVRKIGQKMKNTRDINISMPSASDSRRFETNEQI